MSLPAAIPLVSGRHRNRALAAARHARAIQLATEGRTDQEIADEFGYANRGTLHHIVHQALARDRRGAVATNQYIEMTRLDALQAALWDKAWMGIWMRAARCEPSSWPGSGSSGWLSRGSRRGRRAPLSCRMRTERGG